MIRVLRTYDLLVPANTQLEKRPRLACMFLL